MGRRIPDVLGCHWGAAAGCGCRSTKWRQPNQTSRQSSPQHVCHWLSFISANMAGLAERTTLDSPLTLDYLPIIVTIHLKPTTHQPLAPEKFNLEKADWKRFQLLLSDHRCLDLSRTVDQLNEEITREILKAAKASIPLMRQGLGQQGNPWWNLACKMAVKKKRKAHRQGSRSPSHRAAKSQGLQVTGPLNHRAAKSQGR